MEEFITAILAIVAILLCGWRLIKASEERDERKREGESL